MLCANIGTAIIPRQIAGILDYFSCSWGKVLWGNSTGFAFSADLNNAALYYRWIQPPRKQYSCCDTVLFKCKSQKQMLRAYLNVTERACLLGGSCECALRLLSEFVLHNDLLFAQYYVLGKKLPMPHYLPNDRYFITEYKNFCAVFRLCQLRGQI
jgi:hypothetical protein